MAVLKVLQQMMLVYTKMDLPRCVFVTYFVAILYCIISVIFCYVKLMCLDTFSYNHYNEN